MTDPINYPKPPNAAQQLQPPGKTTEMSPTPDHGERSYRGNGKLENKVAIITGADSGIGRAVAIAFAREGCDIVLSYLNEYEDAEDTADWVRKGGRKAVVVSGDIKSEDHCKALVDRAVGEFTEVDILVNNAAFQRTYRDIADITSEDGTKRSAPTFTLPFI